MPEIIFRIDQVNNSLVSPPADSKTKEPIPVAHVVGSIRPESANPAFAVGPAGSIQLVNLGQEAAALFKTGGYVRITIEPFDPTNSPPAAEEMDQPAVSRRSR